MWGHTPVYVCLYVCLGGSVHPCVHVCARLWLCVCTCAFVLLARWTGICPRALSGTCATPPPQALQEKTPPGWQKPCRADGPKTGRRRKAAATRNELNELSQNLQRSPEMGNHKIKLKAHRVTRVTTRRQKQTVKARPVHRARPGQGGSYSFLSKVCFVLL